MPESDGAARRLRVALDALPLVGNPTGVGVFCRGVLGALGDRDDVAVLAYSVSGRRRHAIEAHVPGTVGTGHRPMPHRPLEAIWSRFDVPPFEWFVGEVDVVHGTNFTVPPTRRAGAVVSVHDLTTIRFPELGTPATLAYPARIRRAVRRGAWVHTDSAFVAAEVVDAFGADPDRVRVVAPGVPVLPAVDPAEARRIVRLLLPRGRDRYVLSIGTAEPRKDLPGLVRAFDRIADDVSDLVLVLAGPGGWGEDALADAVGGARHGNRVVRTGWVDDAVLSALLGGAAALAYPSVYEGFGFPPLQAMAAGIPVVATRTGSLPEVLGDAAALVAVGDHEALAESLRRVLTDEATRARLTQAGRVRAAGFDWARCGEGLARLYRDVADERR